MIEIEKGVPLPSACRDRSKIPYRNMAIGDSVFVPGGATRKVSARTFYWKKVVPESRWTCRAVEGGVRVWRIA